MGDDPDAEPIEDQPEGIPKAFPVDIDDFLITLTVEKVEVRPVGTRSKLGTPPPCFFPSCHEVK